MLRQIRVGRSGHDVAALTKLRINVVPTAHNTLYPTRNAGNQFTMLPDPNGSSALQRSPVALLLGLQPQRLGPRFDERCLTRVPGSDVLDERDGDQVLDTVVAVS